MRVLGLAQKFINQRDDLGRRLGEQIVIDDQNVAGLGAIKGLFQRVVGKTDKTVPAGERLDAVIDGGALGRVVEEARRFERVLAHSWMNFGLALILCTAFSIVHLHKQTLPYQFLKPQPSNLSKSYFDLNWVTQSLSYPFGIKQSQSRTYKQPLQNPKTNHNLLLWPTL